MKRNLLTLAAAGAIALGGFAMVQAQPGHGGGGGWHGRGFGLEGLVSKLNLTSDQQAKVLLSRSTWPMRAHQFRHKRIKLPDQYASRFIIMLERSFNQRACVRIIHVIENASTPLPMTGTGVLRLQFLQLNRENKM